MTLDICRDSCIMVYMMTNKDFSSLCQTCVFMSTLAFLFYFVLVIA